MNEGNTEAGDITSQIREILHDAMNDVRRGEGSVAAQESSRTGKFQLWSWISFALAFLLVLNVVPQQESYLLQRLFLLVGFLAAFLVAWWNLHCSKRAAQPPTPLTPCSLPVESETKPRGNKPMLRRII